MDLREKFSNNFKKLMILNGKSQSDLVEDFNIRQSTISDWTRGVTYPRAESLQMIANYFDVSVEELVGDGRGGSITSGVIKVNIYSRLIPGVVSYNMLDIVGVLEVPSKLGKQGELIALRVKGDYMSPKIDNGDIVIIQLGSEVLNGDVVAFTIGNDDAILRKILSNEYGMTFISTNTNYDPMFFSTSDIKAANIKIIGKVIESRRKF
jgi:repressor LexA